MNRKNVVIGIGLILLGLSMYLRNFNIGTGSLVTVFIGIGLLCGYYYKREQPYVIFGSIFTAIGAMSVLRDIRLLRMDLSFEILLIVIGIMFVFIYYSRNIQGFIFPGTILPAIGIYIILMKAFNDRYVASSIFLLLGFAFYAVYFIAYIGKSGWPLIPATILFIAGILSYGFSFKIISWNIIYLNRNFIWPILMIGAGVLILMNHIRRRN